MAKAVIVKFCTQIDFINSSYRWQIAPKRSHDPFSILTPAIISPERLKPESPNFVWGLKKRRVRLGMTEYHIMGVVGVTWRILNVATIISLELVKLYSYRHFKFHVLIDKQEYYGTRDITRKKMYSESRDLFKFWETNHNISEWVQGRDIVAIEY